MRKFLNRTIDSKVESNRREFLFICTGAYSSLASRACGALGIRFAVLDRCAAQIGVTCATGLTRAHRAMVQRRAVRSLAAYVGERARIDAFVIETGVGRTAVAVVIAFQMDALRLGEEFKK